MKRYLDAIAAVVFTVAMLSFTNSSANSSKFACSWFFYDDPAITNPSLDFPSTVVQAATQSNYRLATAMELAQICNSTRKICAICAEVDAMGRPILTVGSAIRAALEAYFGIPNECSRVPNAALIKEKFSC